LPTTILNAYFYRYKVRLCKDGILNAAKKLQDEPVAGSSKKKNSKLRQVYCVNKRKFFATASEDEMKKVLVLDANQEDKEDAHRILQCRIR
jgi:hypothetical protein